MRATTARNDSMTRLKAAAAGGSVMLLAAVTGCSMGGDAHPSKSHDSTPVMKADAAPMKDGYTVNDMKRPQPPVVTAGSSSTQEQVGKAPSDAMVLFDGADLSKWKSSKDGSDAPWK